MYMCVDHVRICAFYGLFGRRCYGEGYISFWKCICVEVYVSDYCGMKKHVVRKYILREVTEVYFDLRLMHDMYKHAYVNTHNACKKIY